jgi:carbon-monoxide dehydrogenase iron sulfur subunit
MSTSKLLSRKFVSVDPSKCTGCGICEYACVLEKEKTNMNPLHSRIRVVRMAPLFNFALSCRFCEDAKCVTACPEKALSQSEQTGVIRIEEKKCEGCDWCVQTCPHGGITVYSDGRSRVAVACDLCDGEPKCIEFCPEEALELVGTDEEAEKRFNEALKDLPSRIERLTKIIKNKEWKTLLAEAEEISLKVSEKLESLHKKAMLRNENRP